MSGTRFKDLVGHLRKVLAELPDRRKGQNLFYQMEDFGLSAFSVFFTQSPSFLAHQKAMPAARGRNNAPSFFHLDEIPCDKQIRPMLDPVPPQAPYPVYDRIYESLREHGILQTGSCKLPTRFHSGDGSGVPRRTSDDPCNRRFRRACAAHIENKLLAQSVIRCSKRKSSSIKVRAKIAINIPAQAGTHLLGKCC